jgi:hypothetical protein
VLAARRAGIEVMHTQQPEPIKDTTGAIHDPLALSHARGGSTHFRDSRTGGMAYAPTGRIRISTRGGEFQPTTTIWGEYGPKGEKRKELTPDTPFEQATEDDVVSTFRHEVGHIMDKNFRGNKSGTISPNLGREVRAWVHAVEMAPDHKVSARMVRTGLTSHAYFEFRKQELRKDSMWSRVSSWDREERLEAAVQRETDKDPVAHAKAVAFAAKVGTTLQRYGEVLRRRRPNMVRVPEADAPWFPPPERRVRAGPGRARFI